MRAYHNTAVTLLQTAGKTVYQNMDRIDRVNVQQKPGAQFETSIAVSIENMMTERIQELYPSHNVLSRLSGLTAGSISQDDPSAKALTWVIDGLDGAENFIAGFPTYAHSIALFEEKVCIMGLVYQPITDEMFSAIKTHGALYNNKKMRAQRRHSAQQPRLALHSDHTLDSIIETVSKKFKKPLKSNQVHSFGSVSLGLAYHALGTYDIFLAQDAHICSAAAGLLIASEAQAVVKHTQQNERMLSEILSAHSGIKKS